MNKVRLGDVCKLTMGQSPESSSYNDEGIGIPFFQGNADFGELHPKVAHWCSAPKKTAEKGDILISVRAPIGALNIADEKCCIGRGLAAITVDDTIVNRDYIWYILKSKVLYLQSKGTGSTFKAINKSVLLDLSIELPSLSEQKRISHLFQSIFSLCAKYILMDKKLDEFIKSRFVEMFGDPIANTSDYNTAKLRDLSIKISDGVHAKPEYTVTGRPFLSVVNINRRTIDFSNCKYVSEEAYQKMIKSTHPEKGDILYTKVGATYGIPAYVDTDIEFCLYVSVCLIKPKHELINSKFLAIQMDMPFVKYQADKRIKGIGVPDLHLNQISEFEIILPPRELQNQFADFVTQVEKQKATVQQSIDKLETLKKSLMQKYFG